MRKVERQSNIELLRIVLMLMIITHHILVHALGLLSVGSENFGSDARVYSMLSINSLVIVAVNVFVFISGYFGIKFRWKSVFTLTTQAFFYSIVLFLINSIWFSKSFDLRLLIHACFPVLTNAWWFISTFIALMLLSPFINKSVEGLTRQQFKLIVAGTVFLDCILGFVSRKLSLDGYTIYHFISMYLIARYIGQYKVQVKHSFAKFFGVTLFNIIVVIALLEFGYRGRIMEYFNYHNPLIILASCFLFLGFNTINIGSRKSINIGSRKSINAVSSLVLGVYMVHDYPFVRHQIGLLVQYLRPIMTKFYFTTFLVVSVFAIFILAASVEYFRKLLFSKFIDPFIHGVKTGEFLLQMDARRLNILLLGAFVGVFSILYFSTFINF